MLFSLPCPAARAFTRSILAVLAMSLLAPPRARGDEFSSWKRSIDERLDEVRAANDLETQLLLLGEIKALVEEPVGSPSKYLRVLRSLLLEVPDGELFNTVIEVLLETPSSSSLKVLFGVMSSTKLKDLWTRPLSSEAVDRRHRMIEMNLVRLGDESFERRLAGKKVARSKRGRALLEKELESENPRRVRAAAHVLGGWGSVGSAPKLFEALRRQKDAWTRAILFESLGRTDPSVAAEEILRGVNSKNLEEKLAAIPLLGFLHTDAAREKITSLAGSTKWYVRLAALVAGKNSGEVFGVDLMMERFPKERRKIQNDIYSMLEEVTGGVLPPDPKEWARWWKIARKGFKPASKRVKKSAQATELVLRGNPYFGVEIFSDHLAVVFDISGSMVRNKVGTWQKKKKERTATGDASPFDTARAEIKQLLRRFPPKGRFNLVAFNAKLQAFHKTLVKASRGNVAKASKYLGKLKAEGETNTYGAMRLALSDLETDTIVLLSDGEPTRGPRTEPTDVLEGIEVLNRFRGVTIHTVQIGPTLEFMRLLARMNGGRFREVPLADPEEKAEGAPVPVRDRP